jgi:4-amino-4-deoxychorismate lyase
MNALLELLVDGAPSSATWPLDRGLQYGDGLFETMRVQGGRVLLLDLHRLRLAEGCRRLFIHADEAQIWNQVAAVAARHERALLRLQVTRGESQMRGYSFTGREHARWFLATFEAPGHEPMPVPVRVCTLPNRLGENTALAGLKHCNRLEQVLARQAMVGSNAFEGLLASSSGLLISGTMSNVFIELDGEIVTPTLDRCGVAGVMRAAVLREAGRAGILLRVTDVPFESLVRVTALALSNARMGLVIADELDGLALDRNASLGQLAALVSAA